MLDLHCHLIPGLDDGPDTMDEALDIARAMVEHGTTTAVATPHIHWDWPGVTAERIRSGVDLLNDEIRSAGIGLTVLPGAEIALTRAIDMEGAELDELRLGDSDWLLVECPISAASGGLEKLLETVAAHGHRIMLAHPERIAGFATDQELLRRMIRRHGMAGQLTASALLGRFGRRVAEFSWWLVEHDLVQIAASDAHSVTRRPPGVAEVLRQAGLSPAWVDHLAVAGPAAVMTDAPLPAHPLSPPRSAPSSRGRLVRALRR